LAPAAIILHEPDAILLLGLIVAREMGHDVPIAVEFDREKQKKLAGHRVTVGENGNISISA
jgi:predicted aconitase with swiveling domain